jgi:carboxymethylenebutenolidase
MSETFRSDMKDIRLDVFQATPTNAAPAPAIIFLHGSGGSIGLWLGRFAQHLTAAGVSLFAPHYFDSTDTVRADPASLTDGIHVPQWLTTLNDTVRYIAGRPDVDPARIALIGVSLGGFLSLAFAATCSASSDPAEQHRIRAVVELAGGLVEPYTTQATAAFPPTLILHGEADAIVPISHAYELDRRLTELGVPHQMLTFPGEDHWFAQPSTQARLLMTVAGFLSQHLKT